MKNISQKKWFSLSVHLHQKDDIEFLYNNLYYYTTGTTETDEELIFYFEDKNKKSIKNMIDNKKHQYTSDLKIQEIQYENWHANYKAYFKPVKINDKLMVIPDWYNTKDLDHDYIKVIPGMAFGTGNHETTQLAIASIIKYIDKGGTVLDLGSGSGILMIAALKFGASNVMAIEHDEDCKENFLSNMQLNNIYNNYTLLFADVLTIENYNYDVILANINKNIILKLLPRIKKNRTNQCKIILSGLLISDRGDIIDLIEQLGFKLLEENHKGEWICFVIN